MSNKKIILSVSCGIIGTLLILFGTGSTVAAVGAFLIVVAGQIPWWGLNIVEIDDEPEDEPAVYTDHSTSREGP